MAYKKLKYWFDKELARLLSEKIMVVRPDFDAKRYIKQVDQAVEGLELKARVDVLADALHQYLGGTYAQNIKVLMNILGPENEEETGMFSNFYWLMPIAKYVEKYGLKNFKTSIKAMKEITKRNTSEYTIRPYLEQYPKETLAVLLDWSKDKNRHVRRLASEGPRPRLPWAAKLDRFIQDPQPLLPILNNLKDDESKYVQKSVANCINDILKDNPAIGKNLLLSWQKNATKQRKWIMKHALRNLIKQKEPWAVELVEKFHD